MPDEESCLCPTCGKELIGAIEIVRRKTGTVSTVRFEETTDRNWIECDGCRLVLCKICCNNAPSGFCDSCWQRLGQSNINKTSDGQTPAVGTRAAAANANEHINRGGARQ